MFTLFSLGDIKLKFNYKGNIIFMATAVDTVIRNVEVI